MNAFDKLVGLEIRKFILIHDYAQLYFSSGAILTIYSRYNLNPKDTIVDGERCLRIEETQEALRVEFANGAKLTVDLRPEAHTGPEALKLRIPGDFIRIWH